MNDKQNSSYSSIDYIFFCFPVFDQFVWQKHIQCIAKNAGEGGVDMAC